MFETAAELPQEAYLRIARAFSADAKRRKCASCGMVHPEIDLAPYRWAEVARELKAEAAEPAKSHG